MSNPFHDFDWSLKSLGKVFGVFILGVVGLAIVAGIVSFALRTVISPFTGNGNYAGGYAEMAMGSSYSAKSLSSRNILPPIPDEGGGIVDADAEDYEVHNYSASYKTSDKTEICGEVADLKNRKEIIFTSANESDSSCNYRFEVENKFVDEILEILKKLDPEDLNASVYTIQKSVEGTSDQLDILTQKLAQTESTLAEAQKAYEDLMKLATNSRDVENLTQLITLKIDAIEQLAQTQISTNQQIQQVQNNRAEQLRLIANTTFNVSVYEQKFIDWKNIANDWKQEIRNFVSNLNDLTQFVSVKLVSFVLYSAAAILYIGAAFGFLKLVWFVGKKVWRFGQK
ncbi:hypothetical protein K9N08_01715 [Candidatus Gracilibacteria bacterium]|nr:hypothetical protein [Candidatus Gracilibacteria bacterium]MCF7856254.1 hypothetical protein [Candidatus Gracilibacteria bacterium]MCF7896267.1 hypothetical protein [Candidatus Gracilibacteria bacterium]